VNGGGFEGEDVVVKGRLVSEENGGESIGLEVEIEFNSAVDVAHFVL